MEKVKLTKGDTAKELFLQGYNCSQSVLLAFTDDLGIDKQTALLLSSGFGGGIGRMREVCGTISGAAMVLGIVKGSTNPKDNIAKKDVYSSIQELSAQFKKENGTIICRELLKGQADNAPTPSVRNEEYYKKRPCAELVQHTAELLEKIL